MKLRKKKKTQTTSSVSNLDEASFDALCLFLTDASEVETTVLSNTKFYKENKTSINLEVTPLNFVGSVFYL